MEHLHGKLQLQSKVHGRHIRAECVHVLLAQGKGPRERRLETRLAETMPLGFRNVLAPAVQPPGPPAAGPPLSTPSGLSVRLIPTLPREAPHADRLLDHIPPGFLRVPHPEFQDSDGRARLAPHRPAAAKGSISESSDSLAGCQQGEEGPGDERQNGLNKKEREGGP